MTSPGAPTIGPLQQLPVTAATSVKKEGWRGMMRALSVQGRLLVTNHNRPEAVILSTEEYMRLVQAAEQAQGAEPLEALRRQFDARLSALDVGDAGDRMRAVMRALPSLDGQVKAGSSF